VIAAYGPSAYFTMLAALTGTLTVYDLWRKSRRKPVPPEQKGPFISAQPQAMSGQIVGTVRPEPQIRGRIDNQPGPGWPSDELN
jgi:hypothetical protein